VDNPIVREDEKLRRKTDIDYICLICGRKNSSHNTLMKDNQPECLYACLPLVNSLIGSLLKLNERRKE